MTRQKIEIKVPEQYKEINEEIWKDLEEYLFTGFLSSPAKFMNIDFVFKTLNHQELRNIWYFRRSHKRKTEQDQFRTYFIAYSLFVAMGRNVLYNRIEHIDELINTIQKIPSVYQNKILDNLNSLNKRASRLYPLVEVYANESRSRYRWLFLKKMSIHSTESTGIPGTNELGMNYCQQSWVALNEILDKREDSEIAWNHAKFIGSCFAGKGIVSIDEQDKARKSRERQEIDERKMKVLRDYLLQKDGKELPPSDEGTVSLPDGRKAVVEGRFKAETAEELAIQLSASLSGEKDWHDKAVDEYFKKAAAERVEFMKQSQKINSVPREILDSGESATAGSKVLNKKDVDAYVSRMQALMISSSVNPVSPPDLEDLNDRGK